jgi:hypothetical protein
MIHRYDTSMHAPMGPFRAPLYMDARSARPIMHGCSLRSPPPQKTNKQTNKQTDKQTNKQTKGTNKQTNKQTKGTNKQRDQTNKQTNKGNKQTKGTNKQREQTNKQTNKQREQTNQVFEKRLKKETWNNFMELKEQNVIIKHIVSTCPAKVISMWQSLIQRLPSNIICFVRKAIIFCLPNKSNLFRWKLTDNNKCSMCHQLETQLHIFSNCSKYLDRYTWRHDSILNTILKKISRSTCDNVKIHIDLENSNYPCTSDLFTNSRPDIVVKLDDIVVVIELTVCFETNTEKSRLYKINRYKALKEQLVIPCSKFEIIFLEFTTLGFISKISYTPFYKFLTKLGVNQDRTVSTGAYEGGGRGVDRPPWKR